MLNAILAFLKDYGGHCIATLSLGVAALALVNARRATRIASERHAWETEDRAKKQAAEISTGAETEWCERMRQELEGAIHRTIPVPADKVAWAERGEGKYFDVIRQGREVYIVSIHERLSRNG